MDSSAPPAPDYVGAAAATSAGNLANLKYQTTANRPTIQTPWGTQSWTAPDPNGMQTETVTLTPESQAALDSQQAIGKGQSNLALGMQDKVASSMANGYVPPDLSSYMSGIPNVRTNYAGFRPTGANSVNQVFNPDTAAVDLNAPQFSADNAKAASAAAYHSQVDLMQPQMDQDKTNLDSKLRLQGLNPGSEAYDNAMQNLQRTQAQTLTQAANQSVMTGDQVANADYGSALAGYGAKNTAQNQAYGQNTNTFNTNNTAQNQAWTQALAGYGANEEAQTASNTAQAQNYGQALQNYNAAYNSSYQNYLTPLNTMNAVLNGNQVSSPNFGQYSQAGYVGGADYSTAAQNQGQYASAANAASTASANSTMGAIGGIAAAAIMAY